jgi:alkylation response protein AidB-like acyl-CoA dehydrogenase
MDFQRSEDEKMVRQHALELARGALAEHAMERQDSVVPPERITLLTSSGLPGLTAPTRVGGSERAYLEGVLAVEAVWPTRPVTGSVPASSTMVLLKNVGNPEQHKR